MALANYMQRRWGTFTGPRLTSAQIAARLEADPEWGKLCRAIGSPDAQLVREVATALVPRGWAVDVDLISEGMRLACAGNVPEGLVLVGVAIVLLLVLVVTAKS